MTLTKRIKAELAGTYEANPRTNPRWRGKPPIPKPHGKPSNYSAEMLRIIAEVKAMRLTETNQATV